MAVKPVQCIPQVESTLTLTVSPKIIFLCVWLRVRLRDTGAEPSFVCCFTTNSCQSELIRKDTVSDKVKEKKTYRLFQPMGLLFKISKLCLQHKQSRKLPSNTNWAQKHTFSFIFLTLSVVRKQVLIFFLPTVQYLNSKTFSLKGYAT